MGPIYNNHYARILTATNMGRAGKFVHLWDPPQPRQVEPAPLKAPDTAETLKLLEQLSELRDKGILTDEEFETKKKDILSRL